MMTPYEKLKSLPKDKRNLKKGISFDELDEQATRLSDNEAKDQLDLALKTLMAKILEGKQAWCILMDRSFGPGFLPTTTQAQQQANKLIKIHYE